MFTCTVAIHIKNVYSKRNQAAAEDCSPGNDPKGTGETPGTERLSSLFGAMGAAGGSVAPPRARPEPARCFRPGLVTSGRRRCR